MMHSAKGLASAQVSGNTNGHSQEEPGGAALTFEPYFCPTNGEVFDTVKWEKRTAHIKDESGGILFEQKDCEIPEEWSSLATNVVVSKYFFGEPGTPQRETSIRQVVHRVARTIADWGIDDGYFASADDGENFYRELAWLCLHQHGAFNSPVWFNVGLYHQYGVKGSQGNYNWDTKTGAIHRPETPYEYPQGSACFIQAVEDNMEDIMRLATSEAMLFKFGSGTGTDLSTIRSAKEKLTGGGSPSGPLSFMRVYDQIAAVVKSGGKTRRAAKMQSLKDWHPDILDFIQCKSIEEKKARTLIDSGKYDANFNGEAYSSIMFQNANLSVRLSDEFMEAVQNNGKWQTRWVTNPAEVADEHDAKYIMDQISEGTWFCGDPGVQYETTINKWHTCKNSGPINASNPCSEYMFLDDTACNLASINLKKMQDPDGTFNVERFRKACSVYITAQEILVDHASYPTPTIAKNSHLFRPLGLGFANLGSLLMSMGLPYDSDKGRGFAGSIASLMTGEAYLQSSKIAANMGTFTGYAENEAPMLDVIQMHRDAVENIDRSCPSYLRDSARQVWNECLQSGRRHGYRNAQSTVLAPTGTIAFMMDCDTTGIEPDIALVKYKQLAGGGMMKIVNRTVPESLTVLGYEKDEIDAIVKFIDENDTIEGAPGIKDEHLPVFDCAFVAAKGKRSISWEAHISMMAAAQPFLSGAISKTVNMPEDSTVEDVERAYTEGWKLGLKALAIYRDGSKQSQPLGTTKEGDKKEEGEVSRPLRRRLPATRNSVTHKFSVGNHEGYITVGLFEDGTPGELFINMAKEGSTIGGLMDCLGTQASMGLQYGVPLEVLVNKFSHMRFEPSGWTSNQDIPNAKSVVDYIFRWLGIEFLPGYREANTPNRGSVEDSMADANAGLLSPEGVKQKVEEFISQQTNGHAAEDSERFINGELKGPAVRSEQFASFQADAPGCDNCGAITVRNGNCYLCHNCGNSMGCS
jgi:ribonucleoside-diphosphate reductase alpha chain